MFYDTLSAAGALQCFDGAFRNLPAGVLSDTQLFTLNGSSVCKRAAELININLKSDFRLNLLIILLKIIIKDSVCRTRFLFFFVFKSHTSNSFLSI